MLTHRLFAETEPGESLESLSLLCDLALFPFGTDSTALGISLVVIWSGSLSSILGEPAISPRRCGGRKRGKAVGPESVSLVMETRGFFVPTNGLYRVTHALRVSLERLLASEVGCLDVRGDQGLPSSPAQKPIELASRGSQAPKLRVSMGGKRPRTELEPARPLKVGISQPLKSLQDCY